MPHATGKLGSQKKLVHAQGSPSEEALSFFVTTGGGAIVAVADVVGMEVLSATLLSEAGFPPLSFWTGELSITHTCNEKSVKGKAIRSRSKLLSQLRQRCKH